MHRCHWTKDDELMNRYHDEEWGVPVHTDQKHFEFLVLDAFQAGLSWKTILYRREGFRNAFANFEPEKVAQFTDDDFERLMADAGIIRNKLKIAATITNAQRFLLIQQQHGSFDKYIWQFTGHKTLVNKWPDMKNVPAKTAESDAMSKALIKEGFKFVGSTICYAYMQAAGMVNDHALPCFRYAQINNML
jgi:DNA-3-methyladenine glycosylase I